MKARSSGSSRMSIGATARPSVPAISTGGTTPRGGVTPRGRMSVGSALTPRSMARGSVEKVVTPRSRQSVGSVTPRSRQAGNMTPRSASRQSTSSIASRQAEGSVTPRSRRSVGSMGKALATGMTPRERLASSLNKASGSPQMRAEQSENVRPSANPGRNRPPSVTETERISTLSTDGSSKRPGSPVSSITSSGQGSQQSLNMSMLPALATPTPAPTLITLSPQHSRSTLLPLQKGPVKSHLRKRRKTIDAVRPDHVQTAIDTSRTYTSELLAHRSRDYRERSDSLRRVSDAVLRQSRASIGSMLPPRAPGELSYRDSFRDSSRDFGDFSVPSARRYTEGLEQAGISEGSALKVSSVLSFNRSDSRPSITLDSSRSLSQASRFMRSDTSLRMIDPYGMV